MTYKSYACTKCSSTECQTGEIRTTGSGISRFLNLQNQKFGYVACGNCGFCEFYRNNAKDKGWKTDIYKRDSGKGIMDVLDIFTN